MNAESNNWPWYWQQVTEYNEYIHETMEIIIKAEEQQNHIINFPCAAYYASNGTLFIISELDKYLEKGQVTTSVHFDVLTWSTTVLADDPYLHYKKHIPTSYTNTTNYFMHNIFVETNFQKESLQYSVLIKRILYAFRNRK